MKYIFTSDTRNYPKSYEGMARADLKMQARQEGIEVMRAELAARMRRNGQNAKPAAQKPRVTLVRLADGHLRVVNSSAAAKYAGVSHQAFSRVLRRHLMPPKNPKSVYLRIEGMVKAAYPELFDNPTVIEG